MVYNALAPIYDRIMSHVAYDEWVDLIERIAEKYLQTHNPSIYEMGGGTGVLAERLGVRGFRYFGSDRSFAMCRQAVFRGAPFVCADCRAMPVKKPFDLLLFLYDGINYLPTLADYAELFLQAARSLVPGGLFLFDITTEANSLHHFRSYLDFEDWGDYAFVRRSYYNKEQMEQHNDFTIYRRTADGSPLHEKFIERHNQKIFGADLIAREVPQDLFSIIGVWDGFSQRPWRPHSERIHFLLQKKRPPAP